MAPVKTHSSKKTRPDALRVHRDSQNTVKRVTPMGEYKWDINAVCVHC